jgi:nitrite reductase/ring-hydroxylating ferredoxin subunit
MSKEGFVSSIKESEIKEGQMRAVRVKGGPILLVRQGGEVFGGSNIALTRDVSFKEES